MLTLFILSEQKCTVRSALVYYKCSKTSWPVSSKAECLLPGRLGHCYLPLRQFYSWAPWALLLPLSACVCWAIKAGPAWRKRSRSAMGWPSLAVSPGWCRDAALSSRQGWLHWGYVTCISICYSDSFPTLPDLLAPWIGHDFGAVPLLRCLL